jgi:fibronectin-binding autotransporter adhesin
MSSLTSRSILQRSNTNKRSGRTLARKAAVLMSAAAMVSFAQHVGAQTYTWDPGMTGASTGPSGGTGTWDLNDAGNTVWYNGSTDVDWTDSNGTVNTALFSGTAGNVDVNATLGAIEMIFTTPGYVFSGTGSVQLGTTAIPTTTGIDTSAIGTGAETLGNINVGSSQTWNVGSAALTIGGAVEDFGVSSCTITVNGSGTTQFSGGLIMSNTGSTRTILFNGTENVNISGLIQDGSANTGGNTLTDNGTGTLTLSGTSNMFGTSTTIDHVAVDNGVLAIAAAGSLGSSANTLTLGNNTAAPVFEGLGTSTIALGNPVTLGGGGGGAPIIGGATPLNFTGTVTGSGSSDDLNVNNTALTTFSGSMFLSGNTTARTVNIGGSGNLLISAPIANSASAGASSSTLVYLGTGTLTLTNTGNAFTGNLVAENGTVIVPSDGVIGLTNTLALGPASGTPNFTPTFESTGSSLVTIAHPVTIDTASTAFLTIAGTTPLNFSNTVTINTASTTTETIDVTDTGGVTFSSNIYLANGGSSRTDTFGGTGTLAMTGVVANGAAGVTTSAGFTYAGTGTLILGNANTFSHASTVSSGELDVTNTSGSATGTGNLTLNGGILASGSVGAISGNVLAGSASHTIAPGGIGSVGTLTIGGLTSSNLTTLAFDLGTGSGDITNGDLLTLGSGTTSIGAGTPMIFGGATPAAGSDYRLINDTSSGAVVNAIPLGNFTLPAAPAGLTYSLSTAIDSGFIDLVVGSTGPANLTWNNAGGATPADGQTWDINNNANWNNGSSPNTVYTDGANVTFNDTNNATSNGGTNPNAYNVTLSTLVTPTSVTVNNSLGNYTISGTGTIGGTGALSKSGSSSLTLSVAGTYSGGTNVTAGTLIEAAAPAIPHAGSVAISGSGVMKLADNITAGSAFNASNVVLSSLSLTGNGTLDIGNNHIIIDYTTGHDPISTIQQWIANGFNNDDLAGNGPEIISSDIATDDSSSGLSYGIGYADGADELIAGLPSGEIEIVYTLLGDANLDGTVNAEDYTPFSHNIGQSGMSWDDGDFNYDGTVNSEDYTPFSHNIGQSASLAASAGTLEPANNSLSLTNVPEPASASLIALSAISALARRRRKETRS